MVKFFSVKRQYCCILRASKKVIINNEMVKIPAIVCQFSDHNFTTDDEETIKLFRHHIQRGCRSFIEMPSAEKIKKVRAVADKVEKAKKKAEVEARREVGLVPEEEKVHSKFSDFMKTLKKPSQGVVQGVRDITG